MLPVFIINLDRRPDRWAAMTAQLERLGIEAARIRALDAKLLMLQEEFDPSEPGRMVSIGEEACTLSHMKALAAFLRTTHPAALILEDDVEMANSLPGILGSMEWWPRGAGLIKLETHFEKRRHLGPSIGTAPGCHSLHRIAWVHPGAAGYLINRETAEIVLAEAGARTHTMQIDLLLFSLRDSPLARRLEPVQMLPALTRQIEDELFETSDIAPFRPRTMYKLFKKRQRAQQGRWMRWRQKLRIVLLQVTGRVRRRPTPFAKRVCCSPAPGQRDKP